MRRVDDLGFSDKQLIEFMKGDGFTEISEEQLNNLAGWLSIYTELAYNNFINWMLKEI